MGNFEKSYDIEGSKKGLIAEIEKMDDATAKKLLKKYWTNDRGFSSCQRGSSGSH